jgi:hypothetical protein
MQHSLQKPSLPMFVQRAFPVVAVLTIFAAMGYWAGTPSENAPFFILGLGLMLAFIIILGVAVWFLFVKPLPKGVSVPATPISTSMRQVITLLLMVSMINIVVGGTWDEVWHTMYGIPFGEDFWWRPHLMMYVGLFCVAGLGGLSFLWLWRNGQGSWQQRFRANPALGLLVLLAAFLLYVIPADPIWHNVFGEDISSWSLPHVTLASSFLLISLVAVAIMQSTLAQRSWGFITNFSLQDLVMSVSLAFAFIIVLQLLVADWDSITQNQVALPLPVFDRPDWLLATIISLLATFFAVLSTRATKRIGMATLVGVSAFAVRFALLELFSFDAVSADAWLVALPVMLAVDAWYGYRISHRKSVGWLSTGIVAGGTFALVSLPLLARLFVYPIISLQTLLVMLIASFVAALAASFLGTGLGNVLANQAREPQLSTKGQLCWITPTALIGMIAFVIILIVTATPPVAA